MTRMRAIRPWILVAALGAAWPASSAAQDYSFSVPQLQMQVFARSDASAKIVYDITFRNSEHGHPIDIVDIGVPHSGYSLQQITAQADGFPAADIRPSSMVKPGVEVHLGAHTIGPGRSGTLHVEFAMPDMIYQDTTRADYASLQVTPTWFGEPYVVGSTHIEVAIFLPAGVQPDEAVYQQVPFHDKALFRGQAVVTWDWPNERLTRAHKVGVSFPKRDLERVVTMSNWRLLVNWFSESPVARCMAGVVYLVMLAFLFFRFSGGTGFTVFVLLAIGSGVAFAISAEVHLWALPLMVVLIGLNEWLLGHRKTGYMPPVAQVEGGGIKRGLTAPEAAAILELPLPRVLGLVIFGMLKKGLLRQVQPDPLLVEIDPAFHVPDAARGKDAEEAQVYRAAGGEKGVVVHGYEPAFLDLLARNPGQPVRQIDFGPALHKLLVRTASRLSGFNLRQTQEYYRALVRRAVEQARAVGDIPQREQAIDRNFEWILMDDHYPTVFTYGRPYYPTWTRAAPAEALPSAPGAPAAAPRMPGSTTFGDVSGSFAGWAENTMGSLASAIGPGSLQVAKPSGGFLDLSGSDRLSGEFFTALASAANSGGGGGGGGGCACACAGCACACACAGGGR